MGRDVDGLDLRLLHLLFRHRHSQHAVLHSRLHLIKLGILRQTETAEELAGTPLHTVPPVVLLHLLLAPLPTNLQHTTILHLDLDLLFLQSGHIHLEHVSLRRLLPVDPRVGHRRDFSGRGRRVRDGAREREAFEWIPKIQ
ncbi:5-hydroxytryptamine receptor 2A [Striga asiatica]|uniref:5-hydroxytryptamine receptor 2A n=1 Tax=Striga asiatica TaxID=4170 RepID=A0A5A7Q3W1_STRAF|nr:5-hydroxytryptamine receptor 2A [Striga asiatica]